ncbi:hypothetical protein [Micromonospora carbonacea]|uniref:hypothetical protein n=1 Tax=Micromonospora carbonacea TaxID=47853 RepID=UPI0033FAC129
MRYSAARQELERISWDDFRAPNGSGVAVAEIFRRLFDAEQEGDVEGCGLEQQLEVQSMVFEVALPAVGVILAAFAEEIPAWLEMDLLNALHSVLMGEPHYSEIENGNEDLVDRCVESARGGLWVMYARLSKRNYDVLLDILGEADLGGARYEWFRLHCEDRWG